MRSALAYAPRPGLLQSASPLAAVIYLGALVVAAFLFSNPIVLLGIGTAAVIAGTVAGAAPAVRVGLRMGLSLAILMAVVNMLVNHRGETVLARLGDWPLLGQMTITAESFAAGAVIGLRAAAVTLVLVVYSACVDPDRILRALRPIAGRSALTASLISRMVPVAVSDATRLGEAAKLRGPGAAGVGRGALARRVLAGSLDRAVDVAATLELRGYGLDGPGSRGPRQRSRHDLRFLLAGVAILALAIGFKFGGAGVYSSFPGIEIGTSLGTCALAVLIALSGLVPVRRFSDLVAFRRPARRELRRA